MNQILEGSVKRFDEVEGCLGADSAAWGLAFTEIDLRSQILEGHLRSHFKDKIIEVH